MATPGSGGTPVEDPPGIEEVLVETREAPAEHAAAILAGTLVAARQVDLNLRIGLRWGESRIAFTSVTDESGQRIRQVTTIAAWVSYVTNAKRIVCRRALDRPVVGTIVVTVLGPFAIKQLTGADIRREREVLSIVVEDTATWVWAIGPAGIGAATAQLSKNQNPLFERYLLESWATNLAQS